MEYTERMRIAIVYSLPSQRLLSTSYGDTDEDSAVIAKMVSRGLTVKGHTVTLYPIHEEDIAKIAEIETECVFNLIEWCGLDIMLSERAFKYLRELKVPVTGSTEELFVLTGNKIRMKEALSAAKLPIPKGVVFTTGEEEIPDDLSYPLLVKPAYEHCSVGLGHDSIAHNREELRPIIVRQISELEQPVIAEEFIVGRELEVYLLEMGEQVRVLPIEETVFFNKDPMQFLTYESKWEVNHPDYQASEVVLAKLTPEEQKIVESVSIEAFKKMGLRGYARFDVRLKDRIPYLLETNANPSVYDNDRELTDINEEVIWGIKFPDYLEAIVRAAVWHYERGETI
jgi:D-alanine-D-alanine ligase